MRKLSLALMLCVIGCMRTSAQTTPMYTYHGASYQTWMGHDIYTLSDNLICPATATSIWAAPSTNGVLNFYKSFTLDYDVLMVIPPTTPVTGDGMCVVFGNYVDNPVATGSVNAGGPFMGYYNDPSAGINHDFDHSLGIEMDIKDDGSTFNDPPGMIGHVMVTHNGDVTAPVAGPVLLDPTYPDFTLAGWTHMQIVWDCTTQTLSYYCDGNLRLSTYINVSNFDDPFHVHWGFTAGMSGAGCPVLQIQDPIITITGDCTTGGIGQPCGVFDLAAAYLSPGPGGTCNFRGVAKFHSSPWGSVDHATYTLTSPMGTVGPLPVPSMPAAIPSAPTWLFSTQPGLSSSQYTTLTYCAYFPTPGGEFCQQCISKRLTCDQGSGGRSYKAPITPATAAITDDIILYPNPALENITVDLSDGYTGADYLVKDLTGKSLLKGTFITTHQKINIDGLASGIYLLEVSKTGLKNNMVKFVKQ